MRGLATMLIIAIFRRVENRQPSRPGIAANFLRQSGHTPYVVYGKCGLPRQVASDHTYASVSYTSQQATVVSSYTIQDVITALPSSASNMASNIPLPPPPPLYLGTRQSNQQK